MSPETKLEVQIGTWKATYILAETDAPIRYDGFGTLTIYEGARPLPGDTTKTIRYVLVQEDHLDWQEARYRSGLHTFEVPETDLSGYAQKELHDRLVAWKEPA